MQIGLQLIVLNNTKKNRTLMMMWDRQLSLLTKHRANLSVLNFIRIINRASVLIVNFAK